MIQKRKKFPCLNASRVHHTILLPFINFNILLFSLHSILPPLCLLSFDLIIVSIKTFFSYYFFLIFLQFLVVVFSSFKPEKISLNSLSPTSIHWFGSQHPNIHILFYIFFLLFGNSRLITSKRNKPKCFILFIHKENLCI